MARKRTASPRGKARKAPRRWAIRAVALAALIGIIFAAWLWWDMREWRPDETLYPEQGAAISSGAGPVRFETIKALGGAFVYLTLPQTGGASDPGFAARLAAARAAGLKVGVVQPFNLCLRADQQSADFTRLVARDASLLPPAIALEGGADACQPRVSDAAVESELMTLINQIEMHSGKPVILKLGRSFEDRHAAASAMARDLWLMRDRARPDYAGRPWLLWSANSQLVTEAAEEPIEWVVVQK
jgi:lysozyme